MGAPNWHLTRYDRRDATISSVSWGLSVAEIPACEPVALAEVQTASVSRQYALYLSTHMPKTAPMGPRAPFDASDRRWDGFG